MFRLPFKANLSLSTWAQGGEHLALLRLSI